MQSNFVCISLPRIKNIKNKIKDTFIFKYVKKPVKDNVLNIFNLFVNDSHISEKIRK